MYFKENPWIILVVCSGSFAALYSGVNIGWTSPYLPYLVDPEKSHIPTTTNEGLWCAVMPLIGGPFGAFVAALIVDKIGRKSILLALSPIVAVCFCVIAFAKTILVISLARLVIGVTEGALYTVLPIYLGEVADPATRGLICASFPVTAALGTIFINVIGPVLSIQESSLICIAIPLIHFITFMWMPKSPYYEIKRNNFESAKKNLKRLRGRTDVDKEFEEISAAVARQESASDTRFKDILAVPSNRKGLVIYFILSCTNKFSGKNPMMFYTTIIFNEADGFLSPTTSVIIFYIMGLVATVIALLVIDKFGRRPLLLFSAVGCAFALASQAFYFTAQTYIPSIVTQITWLPLVSLIGYNMIFSIGLSFGPVLLLSELFPTTVKAKALCVADSVSALLGLTSSKFFQETSDAYGMLVPFWTFSLCAGIGSILIYKYVIETKGKTLEQIQLELIGMSDKTH
ncbi:PREDICTED: facilitated trehalose transporter Tret1-2 homolog isoform X2 [Nicrophorus vespilloides]|uniref:Facilitated trehalose transporter Tret1-2 homolog isoform X2 n=1 Tax=Nicrophorus vespilloides TaxID=110193 RepID=A0ABM1M6G9_NICVS|nr:PREDICTED: facilitated trehalose transporter Tret1-2 homolog isoform X2 [Nicrophorus vespilloides]